MQKLTDLKGIGEKLEQKLNSLNIFSVSDLIHYYPRLYSDKTKFVTISELDEFMMAALKGVIFNISSKYIPYGRRLHIITASFKDSTGQINITWFNQPYLVNILKENSLVFLYGKIEKKGFFYSMTNPEYSYNLQKFSIIEPIYPKNALTKQHEIRKAVKAALIYTDKFVQEKLSDRLRKKYDLCDISYAVKNIHYPETPESFYIARKRLVFEELFFMQLALLSIKKMVKNIPDFYKFEKTKKSDLFLESLPFTLTKGQKTAIDEISADLTSGFTMNRILQGDVGSGKTVVALYACMRAYENGYQSAFMAPTEILAKQHYDTACNLLSSFDVNIVLLTGSMNKKQKDTVLEDIKEGTADIVIGTHALIQQNVEFNNLTLCITDEQHRFGVAQRTVFTQKGEQPHLLVMSATPIPRTLALVVYGDLDISSIKELPLNRKKVLTYSVDESYRDRIVAFIKKIADKGEQVFVVCPSIYENDQLDISNVETVYDNLKTELFEYSVGILHGKIKSNDQKDTIDKFINNEISVLVATSIIEVGIDIPNSTLIVIEDAQQFGLSQLHQLRGRVGRSDKQSYCILINQSQSDISKKRIKAMVESNDGFYLSEQDLLLRGPGDFFGLKQHGLPDFKIANLYTDMDILKKAQQAVNEEKDNIDLYMDSLKNDIEYIESAVL